MPMTVEELNRRFDYHPPSKPEITAAHQVVRNTFKGCADGLDKILPDGREKSLVLTHIEEAMFWANAAIARAQALAPNALKAP